MERDVKVVLLNATQRNETKRTRRNNILISKTTGPKKNTQMSKTIETKPPKRAKRAKQEKTKRNQHG